MTHPNQKSKHAPANPHHKWVIITLAVMIAGFCLTYIYGGRVINKLQRMALSLTVANQQFAAMQSDDIVLVTINWLANDYTTINLTHALDGSSRFPEWSPDGEWIAFDHGEQREWDEAQRHIYIVNANGSHWQHIARGVSPQWDPNGHSLYFTNWETNIIQAIDIHKRTVTEVISLADCDDAPEGIIANYRLSPDRQSALLEIGQTTYLWDVETETCTFMQFGRNPIWLANGSIVAGNSGRISAFAHDFYHEVQNRPASTRMIPFQFINGSSPSASSQGRYLVYDSSHHVNMLWASSSWTIYAFDTVNGLRVPIIDRMAHPSWRP